MHKTSVPKIKKQEIWNLYIGEDIGKTKCMCCSINFITSFNFHCGHVVAKSKGGTLDVANLRAICSTCNLSMGNKDMISFMKDLSYDTSRILQFENDKMRLDIREQLDKILKISRDKIDAIENLYKGNNDDLKNYESVAEKICKLEEDDLKIKNKLTDLINKSTGKTDTVMQGGVCKFEGGDINIQNKLDDLIKLFSEEKTIVPISTEYNKNTIDNLEMHKYTVIQLRSICEYHNLDTKGNKQKLIDRLQLELSRDVFLIIDTNSSCFSELEKMTVKKLDQLNEMAYIDMDNKICITRSLTKIKKIICMVSSIPDMRTLFEQCDVSKKYFVYPYDYCEYSYVDSARGIKICKNKISDNAFLGHVFE